MSATMTPARRVRVVHRRGNRALAASGRAVVGARIPRRWGQLPTSRVSPPWAWQAQHLLAKADRPATEVGPRLLEASPAAVQTWVPAAPVASPRQKARSWAADNSSGSPRKTGEQPAVRGDKS